MKKIVIAIGIVGMMANCLFAEMNTDEAQYKEPVDMVVEENNDSAEKPQLSEMPVQEDEIIQDVEEEEAKNIQDLIDVLKKAEKK